MIVDSFHYNNESEILSIRLGVLKGIVGRTVVKEAPTTFTGLSKPFGDFSSFEFPIVSQRVEFPEMLTTWERDSFQRMSRVQGLSSDDIVLYGDVDEVPDPSVVERLAGECRNGRVFALSQRFFSGFLNLEVINCPWTGTRMCNAETYLSDLAYAAPYSTVSHAGWHWSYLGGELTIKRKLESFAHSEFNTPEVRESVKWRLEMGLDPVDRKLRTRVIEVDGSYPDYICENQQRLRHLIKWP